MLHRLICSVNIELNDRDSSPRKKQQSPCLLPRPDRLWSYLTFYPMGTQGSVHRFTAARARSRSLTAIQNRSLRMRAAIPPIPIRLYFLLVKHNVQFVLSTEPIFREVKSKLRPPTTSPPSSIFPCIPHQSSSHSVHNSAGSDNHIP